MNQYFNAGLGLKMIYIANAVMLCTMVTAIFFSPMAILLVIADESVPFYALFEVMPAVGVLTFVSFIINLTGLYGAGKYIRGCETAFYITIVYFVVIAFEYFCDSSNILGIVFTFAELVLSFLQIYFVCTSVSKVMLEIGAGDIAKRGNFIWKAYLVCNIIRAVIRILPWILVMTASGGIYAAGMAGFSRVYIIKIIALLVVFNLYMGFLRKSHRTLGA